MEVVKNYDFKNIKSLYKKAFPKNERLNFTMLKNVTSKSNGAFWTLVDDGFKGFCNTIIYQDVCYIFFLAICENTRGKGYGSYILNEMKKVYKDYKICLSIEPIVETATNYDQRVRRKTFYYRNDFKYYGVKSLEPAGYFELLSNELVTKDELIGIYKTILGEFLYKFFRIRVIETKGEK